MTSETRLIGREVIASGTMAFHFAAGQAIDLILPDSVAAEAQSARHTFSIVSAPFEDRIAVATRMRDMLHRAGTSDDDIRSEAFFGY